jgi:mono/diheme cytochrome c family protein
LLAALVIAGAVGAACVWFGAYDIAATEQHTKPVYWLLDVSMRRSVAVRAAGTHVPDLTQPQTVQRGWRLYHANCLPCHGAPGVAPAGAALGMTPVPKNLVKTAHEWDPAEIRWVVKYGVKMTAMPAWNHRMTDDEIWSVVAFVTRALPSVSPTEYRDVVSRFEADAAAPTAQAVLSDGEPPNAARGKHAIEQYACVTCHGIPGVTGAVANVGPPLDGIANRNYIAGRFANTRENMVRWLMSPQSIKPGSAMPDLAVREQDARDMADYLATLTSR